MPPIDNPMPTQGLGTMAPPQQGSLIPATVRVTVAERGSLREMNYPFERRNEKTFLPPGADIQGRLWTRDGHNRAPLHMVVQQRNDDEREQCRSPHAEEQRHG